MALRILALNPPKAWFLRFFLAFGRWSSILGRGEFVDV
jgi:hypothetical protein